MVTVDYIEFKNGKTLKVGDKIIPKSQDHFRSVYGPAYEGGAYNSRPEIAYKFNNRLGVENEIAEIRIRRYYSKKELNTYEYGAFLLVLKKARCRTTMLIDLDDCHLDEYKG